MDEFDLNTNKENNIAETSDIKDEITGKVPEVQDEVTPAPEACENAYSEPAGNIGSTGYNPYAPQNVQPQKYGISYSPDKNGYNQTIYGEYKSPEYSDTGDTNSAPHENKKRNKRGKGAIALIIAACILLSAVSAISALFIASAVSGGGVFGSWVDVLYEGGRTSNSGTDTAKTPSTQEPSGTLSGADDTNVKQINGSSEGDVTTPIPQITGKVSVSVNNDAVDYSTDMTDSIAGVKDAVVEIYTKTEVEGIRETTVSEGAGSGVIVGVSENKLVYYIITNNHVIEDADTISIRLANGTVYNASLLATDASVDLAVLTVTVQNGTELVCATVGNSDLLIEGQDVFVIGNPLGELGGSVTVGVISGLSRRISIDNVYMTLLQTDAAVNPGNSGGGIFDIYGNLIGIVNAKSTGSTVDGLGYAIPINTAVVVLNDLLTKGYVSGPGIALGLMNSYFTYGFSQYSCTAVTAGAELGFYTDADGDSQSFTFLAGDCIYAVGDRRVTSTACLMSLLRQYYEVGDTVTLIVVRQSNKYGAINQYEVTVTLTDYAPVS